jgi:hypothetical protein
MMLTEKILSVETSVCKKVVGKACGVEKERQTILIMFQERTTPKKSFAHYSTKTIFNCTQKYRVKPNICAN